jgi:hypothetical protein
VRWYKLPLSKRQAFHDTMTTTAAPATITPIRDAEFGAGAFAMLVQMMHQTSQVADGDSVHEWQDGSLNVVWPGFCCVHVRRESLVSRNVTVSCGVGFDVGTWLLAKGGELTVAEVDGADYEFCATVSDFASLDRVMQELIELRAVCSSPAPEEILAYDFGAMRMDMD